MMQRTPETKVLQADLKSALKRELKHEEDKGLRLPLPLVRVLRQSTDGTGDRILAAYDEQRSLYLKKYKDLYLFHRRKKIQQIAFTIASEINDDDLLKEEVRASVVLALTSALSSDLDEIALAMRQIIDRDEEKYNTDQLDCLREVIGGGLDEEIKSGQVLSEFRIKDEFQESINRKLSELRGIQRNLQEKVERGRAVLARNCAAIIDQNTEDYLKEVDLLGKQISELTSILAMFAPPALLNKETIRKRIASKLLAKQAIEAKITKYYSLEAENKRVENDISNLENELDALKEEIQKLESPQALIDQYTERWSTSFTSKVRCIRTIDGIKRKNKDQDFSAIVAAIKKSVPGTKKYLSSAKLKKYLAGVDVISIDRAIHEDTEGEVENALFWDAIRCWVGEYKKTKKIFPQFRKILPISTVMQWLVFNRNDDCLQFKAELLGLQLPELSESEDKSITTQDKLKNFRETLVSIFNTLNAYDDVSEISDLLRNRCHAILNKIDNVSGSSLISDRVYNQLVAEIKGNDYIKFICNQLKDANWQKNIPPSIKFYAKFHQVYNPKNDGRSDSAAFLGLPSEGNIYNFFETMLFVFTLFKNIFVKSWVEFLPAIAEEFHKSTFLQGVHFLTKRVASPWRFAKAAFREGNMTNPFFGLLFASLSLGVSALGIAVITMVACAIAPAVIPAVIAAKVGGALTFIANLPIISMISTWIAAKSGLAVTAAATGVFSAYVVVPIRGAIKSLGKKCGSRFPQAQTVSARLDRLKGRDPNKLLIFQPTLKSRSREESSDSPIKDTSPTSSIDGSAEPLSFSLLSSASSLSPTPAPTSRSINSDTERATPRPA